MLRAYTEDYSPNAETTTVEEGSTTMGNGSAAATAVKEEEKNRGQGPFNNSKHKNSLKRKTPTPSNDSPSYSQHQQQQSAEQGIAADSATDMNEEKRPLKRSRESRSSEIRQWSEKLGQVLSKREVDLKELLHLSAGGSMLAFDPQSPATLKALRAYETGSALAEEAQPASGRGARTPPRQSAPSAAAACASPPTLLSVHSERPLPLNALLYEGGGSKSKLAEKAAHDAAVLNRASELKRQGLWSLQKLPKIPEQPRKKTHWDFLLEEATWLACDFQEERKWKLALAKKISRQVMKYHQAKKAELQRVALEKERALRRTAAFVAGEVKRFWQNIETLVVTRHQNKLKEKKKEVLDKHLDFLVGQTERYSSMLAEGLNTSFTVPTSSSASSTQPDAGSLAPENEATLLSTTPFSSEQTVVHVKEEQSDRDAFVAKEEEEEDDESTLEQEERMQMEQDPLKEDEEEIGMLQRESEVPLEELLRSYYGYENEDSERSDSENDREDGEDQADKGVEEGEEEEEEEEEEADEDEEEEPFSENEFSSKEHKASPKKESSSTIRALEEDMEETNEQDAVSKKQITAASEAATEAQPTGNTLSTTTVKTKVPFLLKHTLREYQHIGLDWLVTMYEKRLNGILADEMGLGKTIQTIALLAHLACERGIWGPHLVVVPTSVMLNWECEFRKWCPAFKILTYYGTPKERKLKRQGWSKTNSFHVCITSYTLVLQDHQAFRRKKWKYLILDEAHHIKNFRSKRWQLLLNFNAKRRLLLTGTPLQNDLMELWSLMHFLMPHIFQSHSQFKKWFSKPVNSLIEGVTPEDQQDLQGSDHLINRLHSVLRPFLLRRLKSEVEHQLPRKVEHVLPCKLSKRQRLLYEEFINNSTTQEKLASGNFISIANVLMQLRKVCNHPDLFEGRPIISPLDMEPLVYCTSPAVVGLLDTDPRKDISLSFMNLIFSGNEQHMSMWQAQRTSQLHVDPFSIRSLGPSFTAAEQQRQPLSALLLPPPSNLVRHRRDELCAFYAHLAYLNEWRCAAKPLYGWDLRRCLTMADAIGSFYSPTTLQSFFSSATAIRHPLDYSSALQSAVLSYEERVQSLMPIISSFVCIIPPARTPPPVLHTRRTVPHQDPNFNPDSPEFLQAFSPALTLYRPAFIRQQLYFPDKRLVQYDCGKLQQLDPLLRRLKSGGHRALIFTQMTRMLDVLEVFLNIHGHTYVRLDGTTNVEQRQRLMERFNADDRIFLFILSTRTGGLGVNLTGADTVIFYDSDWNPAMDQQAQDRCHRIGQTREVNIFRLVTQHTIEENILKKANQKRQLHDVVISEGRFTTDSFKRVNIQDLIEGIPISKSTNQQQALAPTQSPEEIEKRWEEAVAEAEDENDVMALNAVKAEQASEMSEFADDVPLQDLSRNGQSRGSQQANGEESLPSTRLDSFVEKLLPIQRYAFKYLDEVDPVVDLHELEALREEAEIKEKEWELDVLERIRQEEEQRMEEDDEMLFYEVPCSASGGGKEGEEVEDSGYPQFMAQAYATAMARELEIYGPPTPESDDLYVPPYEEEPYPFSVDVLFSDVLLGLTLGKGAEKRHKSLKLGPNGSLEQLEEEEDSGTTSRRKRKHLDDKKQRKTSKTDKKKKKKKKKKHGRLDASPNGKTISGTGRARRKSRSTLKTPQMLWLPSEDALLREAIRLFGDKNWELISDYVNPSPFGAMRYRFHAPSDCAEHWVELQKGSTASVEIDTQTTSKNKSKGQASTTTTSPQPPLPPLPFVTILAIARRSPDQPHSKPGRPTKSASQSQKQASPKEEAMPHAHISHAQASAAAGSLPSKPARTPLDVFMQKIRRVLPSATPQMPTTPPVPLASTSYHHHLPTSVPPTGAGPASTPTTATNSSTPSNQAPSTSARSMDAKLAGSGAQHSPSSACSSVLRGVISPKNEPKSRSQATRPPTKTPVAAASSAPIATPTPTAASTAAPSGTTTAVPVSSVTSTAGSNSIILNSGSSTGQRTTMAHINQVLQQSSPVARQHQPAHSSPPTPQQANQRPPPPQSAAGTAPPAPSATTTPTSGNAAGGAGAPQSSPTTPWSTMLALYSITQLPSSTPHIQEIVRRKDIPEATKVEMLRRVIQEHTAAASAAKSSSADKPAAPQPPPPPGGSAGGAAPPSAPTT
ncbi:Pharynx and intestine in excess protein 1 [Balamuthia mandrillaris]